MGIIGVIHSPHRQADRTPIQAAQATGMRGTVELFPQYATGLSDLDGFERIWLVYWFDRAKPAELVVTPYLDTTPRGLLATRAPCRPNPIGLSCVRLLEVRGNILHVEGLDILDGTPLLEIKPYSRRLMRSRRSESAGALRAGAAALWPMVDLKLAEAGIWTHKLYSRMSARVFKLVFLCGLAVAAGCKTESQRAAGAGEQAGHDHNLPGIDCPLRKAGVDPSGLRPFAEVEKYIAFLDRPDRAAWQKPDDVVAALGLQGNETVFDLGAGSGYFSFKLAQAVSRGKVVAGDLEPEMIRHIHHKAMVEGITNLTPVIIKADDPEVPRDTDYVFVCDVLHHLQDRPGWLKKAASEMKLGARFVLIEFKEGKLPEGPPEAVKIPRKQLIELVSQAGLSLEAEKADLLPYQLFLVFRKG